MTATQKGTSSNRRTALWLGGLVTGMIGLAYASVPLYELFCRVTGFGGTTQIAQSAPEQAAEAMIEVRFDANVARGLPWDFQPLERSVRLHIGEERVVLYRATNRGDHPITATATFNVTPLKSGGYFAKVACFCFTEQTLAPGQSIDMPVSFFVDPAILDDPNMRDVSAITLSYTFYEKKTDGAKAEGKI